MTIIFRNEFQMSAKEMWVTRGNTVIGSNKLGLIFNQ